MEARAILSGDRRHHHPRPRHQGRGAMSFTWVMPLANLGPGQLLGVIVKDRPILLVNLAGTVCAYADRCAHQGAALSLKGCLEGSQLVCQVHDWRYDAA